VAPTYFYDNALGGWSRSGRSWAGCRRCGRRSVPGRPARKVDKLIADFGDEQLKIA
jgi:hypothetical protein